MTVTDLSGPSFWRFNNLLILLHRFAITFIIMSIRTTAAFNLVRHQYCNLSGISSLQQRCVNISVYQPPSSMITSTSIIRSAITSSSIKHPLRSSSSTMMHNSDIKEEDEEDYTLTLNIPTPEDMEDIGALLSVNSHAGDIILLDGDLGAGKTCFSRGFIRAKIGSIDERVTSPTYLLSNTYTANNNDDGGGEDDETKIYHMDLYRLSGQTDDELVPLDLENVFTNHISLIEWPSRLRVKPEVRLDVTLTIDSTMMQQQQQDCSDEDDEKEDEEIDYETRDRCMKLVPHGDRWVERLKFLEEEGYLEDLII